MICFNETITLGSYIGVMRTMNNWRIQPVVIMVLVPILGYVYTVFFDEIVQWLNDMTKMNEHALSMMMEH